MELVKKKCMPQMLYGLDACPVNKTQIQSLQFAVTGMLMKTFNTKLKDIIDMCSVYFHFDTVNVCILKRKHNFLLRFGDTKNVLCHVFSDIVNSELHNVTIRLKSC